MTLLLLQSMRSQRSTIAACVALGLGLFGSPCSSVAQRAPERFAVAPSQILAAMQSESLPIDGASVKIAAPITSSRPDAQIEVLSAAPAGQHDLRLRVTCSDRKECLPFFAIATFPDAVDVHNLHLGHGVQPSTLPVSRAGNNPEISPAPGTSATQANDTGMLRAGSPATLELDADRIHVRVEVICLQGGTPGTRIRVSSLDHKQIYTAEVITPTLLKGDPIK